MAPVRSLAELCTKVTSGGTPSRQHPEYFAMADSGHLWVKSKELLDGSIENTEEKISDLGLQKSSAKYLPANTVLVAMYGANVGQLGWLRKPATVNQAICGLVVNYQVADFRYVFYALLATRRELIVKAQGAAQQNLNQDAIKNFKIPAPSLDEQRRIASILSAYDDLIENNTRRIAILEEMAQRIYEEWFVHFRFPGHEQVQMHESVLGLVPIGWEPTPVPDAVIINPSVRVPKDGMKPFVPMGCLSNDSMLISNVEMREGNSGSKFQNGDTLFARITPCLENGKTGYVQFQPTETAVAFGSTEFIVLRSKTLCPEYVYLLARSESFRANAIKSMSGATGRQRVKEACFASFLIAQPDSTTLKLFQQAVSPMFRMVKVLAQKNANLRSQRDLLLPKLISGEIDVSNPPEPEALAA